jgi:hypothetical protein
VLLAVVVSGCGHGNAGRHALGFSPVPGTPVASPRTQISVRGTASSQLRDITVTGSRSGRHTGRLEAHPEGLGASFIPSRQFDPGETVAVRMRVTGVARPIQFHFTIARPAKLALEAGPPGQPTRADQVQSFRSAPELRPPTVTVTAHAPDAATGDMFVSPSNKLGQAGPMILDGDGRLAWFHPLAGKEQAFDFRAQRYEQRPVLTWWQGVVITRGFGVGSDVIFNSSYRQVATINPGDGYRADLHEFLITPRGTALIVAYNPVQADLSSVSGPRDGIALDCVIQELDIRTGLVLFEWHSIGNVALTESYTKPAKDGLFDYFHANSIDRDSDGNLIVSARNTWAIYKINYMTGKIMWRLGGKKSSFHMAPATHFAYQHDARRQPDGSITLFDNGATPTVHPQSRSIALKLDMKAMRATLAREWTHPGKLLAGSQGNMQTLPNRDRFVGWGAEPNLTEYSPNGRIVFDGALARPASSYRAYRLPWNGTPPGHPAIATTAEPDGKLTIYASWNGATDVSRWQILVGTAASRLKPLTVVPDTGFETKATEVTRASDVAVAAQNSAGRDLGTSETVKPGESSL